MGTNTQAAEPQDIATFRKLLEEYRWAIAQNEAGIRQGDHSGYLGESRAHAALMAFYANA